VSLYVDPAGLTGLEGMARRGGEDASDAQAHFDKHGEIEWKYEGVINILQGDVTRIRQDVLAFLDMAGHTTLPATANAIAHSRDYYARTDQANAERIDATMPGTDVAAESRGVPGPTAGPSNRDLERFTDVHEPTGRLGEVPTDGSSYNMDHQPKWHDMVSPSAVLRDAIFVITGHDPYEEILKPLCGDWVGMARVGHVLNQVSWCARDIAGNQSWAAQCLLSAWTGNAGDAASAHLFRLARSLQTAADTMDQIATMYRTSAKSAFDLADVIGSLISSISDAALAAAAAGSFAGGAAATGVGLPLAGLAALVGAYEVGRVISTVIDVIDYVGKFDSMASALKSSLDRFGRIDGDVPLPQLPELPRLPQ
jgi:hypothetical protein